MFGGFDPFDGIGAMMRQQMQDMDNMMGSMMGGPFGAGGIIMPGMFGQQMGNVYGNPRQQMIDDNQQYAQQRQRHNDRQIAGPASFGSGMGMPMMMPFGGGLLGPGFMGMGGLFQQMEAMTNQATNDPNSLIFSESKVVSMAPGPDGRLQTYEATDSMRKHGDVKETRSTVRDPSRGVESMSIGHHIGQRGHVIEKKRVNRGDIQEVQKFINMHRDNARQFDQEWSSATRNAALSGRHQLYDDRVNRHLPIESRRSEPRERHASPYSRSKTNKKTKGPIIEEVD